MKRILIFVFFLAFLSSTELRSQGFWKAHDYYSLMDRVYKRVKGTSNTKDKKFTREVVSPDIADAIFQSEQLDVLFVGEYVEDMLTLFEVYSFGKDTVAVNCKASERRDRLLKKSVAYRNLADRVRAGQYQEVTLNEELKKSMTQSWDAYFHFLTETPRYSRYMCLFSIDNSDKQKQKYDMKVLIHDAQTDTILMVKRTDETKHLYKKFYATRFIHFLTLD